MDVAFLPLQMCTLLIYWSSYMHAAISIHHEMIANRFETLLSMPAVDVGSPKVHALRSGGTMDHY